MAVVAAATVAVTARPVVSAARPAAPSEDSPGWVGHVVARARSRPALLLAVHAGDVEERLAGLH